MEAPDGLQFAIGHDLIEATMSGGKDVKSVAAEIPKGNSTSSQTAKTGPPASQSTNKPSPSTSDGRRRAVNPLRRLFRK